MLYTNGIFAVLVFVFNFVYLKFGYLTENGLILKSSTVIWFGILAIINAIYVSKTDKISSKFAKIMPIGSVVAMLGDIIIGVDFLIGAALFAAGHICFIISYIQLTQFSKRDFFISGLIFVISALFLLNYPSIVFPTEMMKYIAILYAIIISFMLGKAISIFSTERNILTTVLLIGSVLFFFSDIMLVFECFVGLTWAGKLCMALYCPAECLLAFSIFLYGDEKGVR